MYNSWTNLNFWAVTQLYMYSSLCVLYN